MAKISQAAAEKAAYTITEPIQVKIKEAESALSEEMGSIYQKHLPSGLMELFERFPKYCKIRSGVQLSGNGFNYRSVQMDKKYPDCGEYTFTPTASEASKLQKLIDKVEALTKSRKETRQEIENTILALGTHKRVETEFPEALPYLPQTNGNTTIIVAIKPIRDKVKKLTLAA